MPDEDKPQWSQFAKPGPYVSRLTPEEEQKFRNWVVQNRIPWQDIPKSDYDMRGYWKAMISGDPNARTSVNQTDQKPHYPDTWKTPYHKTFSRESVYSLPSAGQWEGERFVPPAETQEITAVNPTNGKRIRWDGKAWVPLPEGTLSRGTREYKEELRGSMGFTPEGGVMEDIKTIGSGLSEEARHPIESASLVGRGASSAQQAVIDKAYEEQHSQNLLTKAHGLIRGVYAALPGLGPIMSHAGDLFESGHFAGGAGAMTPLAIMQALETPMGSRAGVAVAEAPGKAVTAVGDVATSGMREMLGVPERAIEKARTEHTTKMAEVQLKNLQDHNTAIAEYDQAMRQAEAEHQKAVNETEGTNLQKAAAHKLKVEQIKEAHAAKLAKDAETHKTRIAEVNREYEKAVSSFNRPGEDTASATATAAEVKRKSFLKQPRSGPVYQRVAAMADKIGESIPKLTKTVRAAYDARWGAWREAMGDAEGNFTPVQMAVQEAEDTMLKGSPENITIFRNILKEGEDPILAKAGVFRGGGLDIKEITGSRYMSDATRDRVMRSLEDAGVDPESGRPGPVGDVTIPIDDIRGYKTELQQKMFAGRFTGDVYRALKHVEKAAEQEIERVAKSKGKLPEYKKLNSDWSQFMGDFYDPEGALKKLGNSVNSDTRISLLQGAEGSRVIEAMGRYAKFNPDIQAVGRLRSLMKQINELPSSGATPERGEMPPRPAARPEPTIPPAPTPKALPEFKPPELKLKEPADVIPFDLPKFVKDRVEKQAERIGIAGHTLIGYWILRDLFHLQMPSPGLIAMPFVQEMIRRYLSSEKFIGRVTRMVEKGEAPIGSPSVPSRPATPPAYRPSEKAGTMSGKRKSLGPEFERGELTHEIDRYEKILRNPRATAEDRQIAKMRLMELRGEL